MSSKSLFRFGILAAATAGANVCDDTNKSCMEPQSAAQTSGAMLLQKKRQAMKGTYLAMDETDAADSGIAKKSNASKSLKKGIIMAPTSRWQCVDMGMYNPDNYGWWYSWRQAPVGRAWDGADCHKLLANSNFMPMIKNQLFLEENQLEHTYAQGDYLLGFNEPYGDHTKKNSGVGIMRPQDAVDAMKKVIETANKYNMKVVAPTVNPKKSAMTWYKDFYTLAKEQGVWDKFSAINVHTHCCDVPRLMKKLKMVYKRFGLPLWITEFNCHGKSHPETTPAQHLDFMKAALPEFEHADYVERYAWYSLRNRDLPHANLAKGEGVKEDAIHELTELGKFYDSFHPDSSDRAAQHGNVDACREGDRDCHEREDAEDHDAEEHDADSEAEWYRHRRH